MEPVFFQKETSSVIDGVRFVSGFVAGKVVGSDAVWVNVTTAIALVGTGWDVQDNNDNIPTARNTGRIALMMVFIFPACFGHQAS